MSRFEVCTDPVRINAPVDLVWSVLTGVDGYAEWNPFTPRVQTDFKTGSPVHLQVRMGPAKMKITEYVCAFDKPRLIAWNKMFGARWLLFAQREQHLQRVSDTSCSYHNTDRLSGVLAPLVFLCFGGYMRRGFDDVGKGLKYYAETRYFSRGTPKARNIEGSVANRDK